MIDDNATGRTDWLADFGVIPALGFLLSKWLRSLEILVLAVIFLYGFQRSGQWELWFFGKVLSWLGVGWILFWAGFAARMTFSRYEKLSIAKQAIVYFATVCLLLSSIFFALSVPSIVSGLVLASN